MDYDKTKIASAYDSARAMPEARMKRWLERFVASVPPANVTDIIDLGCGTGRFSQTLADLYGARLVGIDPSETMLAQAKSKAPQLTFLLGAGEAIPVADESADLVFISLVYHHLRDRAKTARECLRVLRPGGSVMIRTTIAEERGYLAFERFFPGYKDLAHQTVPTRAALREAHAAAGLVEAANETIHERLYETWDEFAAKAALRADSFLARLPDDVFEAGVAAARAYAAGGGGPTETLTEGIDLFVFRKP
jgi:ubiquinone/menaquinone biosynthesis C-methylase UbiE